MSINLTCDCGKKLRVNEDKIGKRVKCPGCQAILSVPAPASEAEPPRKVKQAPPPSEPDDEPEPPRKAKSKPVPVDDDSDEEEPKPAKSKKRAPVEDDADEDEDEKPAKGKQPAKSSSGKLVLFIVLGAVVFIGGGAGVGLAVYYFLFVDTRPANIRPTPQKGTDNKTDKPDVIEPRARFTADLGKEGDARKIGHILLSQDGKRIAISNAKSQVWDIAGEPKKLHDFEGPIGAMSPDGKTVVVYQKDGRFLVDADTGKPNGRIRADGFVFFQNNTTCWTISPFLDAQKRKKAAAVRYTVADGKTEKELELENKGDRFARTNDNGEVFFVSKTDVQVWDSSTEKWTRQFSLKPDAGESILLDVPLAVSPDGKWLMTSAGKVTFDPVIFDLSTGTATKIPKTEFFPHNPTFIPNRDILLGSSSNEPKKYKAVAFDVKANAVVGAFGTVESIAALAVSGDGATLAAGTLEGEVVLWDVSNLK